MISLLSFVPFGLVPVFPTNHFSLDPCSCCGGVTKLAEGTVKTEQYPETDYWVKWSENHPESSMLFVVTDPSSKRPVASLYSLELTSFMVVGSDNEFMDLKMLDDPLSREEVIGTPLATQIFAYLDEIFVNDSAVSAFASTPLSATNSVFSSLRIRVLILFIVAIAVYLLVR